MEKEKKLNTLLWCFTYYILHTITIHWRSWYLKRQTYFHSCRRILCLFLTQNLYKSIERSRCCFVCTHSLHADSSTKCTPSHISFTSHIMFVTLLSQYLLIILNEFPYRLVGINSFEALMIICALLACTFVSCKRVHQAGIHNSPTSLLPHHRSVSKWSLASADGTSPWRYPSF